MLSVCAAVARGQILTRFVRILLLLSHAFVCAPNRTLSRDSRRKRYSSWRTNASSTPNRPGCATGRHRSRISTTDDSRFVFAVRPQELHPEVAVSGYARATLKSTEIWVLCTTRHEFACAAEGPKSTTMPGAAAFLSTSFHARSRQKKHGSGV